MASPYKMKFSPSHSKRWINCAGSARLVAEIPPQPSSKHAMEGTAAHELASNCLKLGQDAVEWVGEEIEVEEKLFKVTEEMAENVQIYLDTVRGDLEENGLTTEELSVETKFQVEGIACLKGTNDASFSSPMGKLYVYDYKHGAGTYVEVEDNSQLQIYALGAMEKAGWVNEEVEIVIVQPRYEREGLNRVRRWTISKEDLTVFKGAVQLAIDRCMDPMAPCTPGSWCKESFCPAFGVCPAVRTKAMSVVDKDNKSLVFPDPAKLTPEEVAKVLEASSLIAAWAKAVRDHAERQAIDLGVNIPGYKLISKKGRRAWIDEMLTENEFEHEFGDAIYDKKLKSPAQLEKVVGKDRVKELTQIPDKGLELVPEGAKGDAVAAPNQVFKVIEGGE